MWRYCQGEQRVCSASLETIGNNLRLDRATVMRHISRLVEIGYLEDLTPGRRNRPHVYCDTGKAGAESSKLTVAERNTGVAESNTTVAERNTGVAESHMKIQEETIKKVTRAQLRALDALFADLTGIPVPAPSTVKERKREAERWYQPMRRMLAMANGQVESILRETVDRMRRDRLTISAPRSIENTFTAVFGERASDRWTGGAVTQNPDGSYNI